MAALDFTNLVPNLENFKFNAEPNNQESFISKKQTTSEFNISQFRAEVYLNGILKQNKFLLNFSKPKLLNNLNLSSVLSAASDTRFLTTRCDSAVIPGVTFFSTDNIRRYGYGQIERRPYLPAFNPINISFIVDRDADVINFFHTWANNIVNYDRNRIGSTKNRPYFLNYKDDYISKQMNIYLYDENIQTSLIVNLYDAYPINTTDISLNWDETTTPLRFNVQMQYTDYTMEFLQTKSLSGAAITEEAEKMTKGLSLSDRIASLVEGRITEGVVDIFDKSLAKFDNIFR